MAGALAAGRAAWLGGLVVAHRGLHDAGGRVENSPAAFAAAIAAGLAIECDVQESADGAAMVFHDDTLDRLTGETGPLIARPAAWLAGVRLANGEPIWPLARLLGLVAGQVPLLVEIKTNPDRPVTGAETRPVARPVGRLCAAVAAALAGYRGCVAVMSFDARVGRWFAAHAPQVVRGLVLDGADLHGPRAALLAQRALRPGRQDFLAVDRAGLPSPWVAAWRAAGLPIACWTLRSARQWAQAAPFIDAAIIEGGAARALCGARPLRGAQA